METFNDNYLNNDEVLHRDDHDHDHEYSHHQDHAHNHHQQHHQQQPQQQQLADDVHQVQHLAPPPPVVEEEELLAAQAAAEAAAAQQAQQPGGAFNNVGQGLSGKYRDMMMQYWQETINSIEHDDHDFRNHQLPLARIKKVMKTDEDVRMISAEAPILFAKGCDVFITELTMRAWIHAEENKRRTLQKSDIAAALTKSDMFDFLIDVVPREEDKGKKYGLARTNGYSHPTYHEPVAQQVQQPPYEQDVTHQTTMQHQEQPPAPPLAQMTQQQTQFQGGLQQATPTQEELGDQQYVCKQEEGFSGQFQNHVGEDVLQQQMLHQQVMAQQDGSPRPPYQQYNLYNQGYGEYQ
jgi:histone H3/H4